MVDITVFTTILSEYGPFVALVCYMLWTFHRREQRSTVRENEFIEETRIREQRYIEREDKYIDVIEGSIRNFTDTVESIREDVSYIKNKVDGGD